LVPRIKRLCLVFHFFSFTFSQTDGILHQDQEPSTPSAPFAPSLLNLAATFHR
jgi:hypothetical protein